MPKSKKNRPSKRVTPYSTHHLQQTEKEKITVEKPEKLAKKEQTRKYHNTYARKKIIQVTNLISEIKSLKEEYEKSQHILRQLNTEQNDLMRFLRDLSMTGEEKEAIDNLGLDINTPPIENAHDDQSSFTLQRITENTATLPHSHSAILHRSKKLMQQKEDIIKKISKNKDQIKQLNSELIVLRNWLGPNINSTSENSIALPNTHEPPVQSPLRSFNLFSPEPTQNDVLFFDSSLVPDDSQPMKPINQLPEMDESKTSEDAYNSPNARFLPL